MFNVAAGFFPSATAATSVAVRLAWGAALWPRFSVDDVCYALARLAEHVGTDADPRRRQRRETFPDLGELIDAADEEKRRREADARPKIEKQRIRGSITEQLEAFDLASLGGANGPYQNRVRELIAAGAFQSGSKGDAMAQLHPFTYQAGHAVLSRAMSDTPPPVQQVTPELVKELVDAWEADGTIDVTDLSIALRTACREEVERRRKAKETA